MSNKGVTNTKNINTTNTVNVNSNTQHHFQRLRELFQQNHVEDEQQRRIKERIEEEKARQKREDDELKRRILERNRREAEKRNTVSEHDASEHRASEHRASEKVISEKVVSEKVVFEKIKNNITELVFILDRSGSMSGLESDTIGGFNAMIEKQKKQEGECYVSTILFDHTCDVLHDRMRLQNIPKMTTDDYTVRGCTALIDAIGGAIHHIENIHKYARREDVPEHVLFVITTDGMENASHKYTSDRVKKMIEHHKEKDDWEFIFIGANIDAVETAANFGISYDRAVNYKADSKGTKVLYDTVATAACNVRSNKKLNGEWSKAINDDYNSSESTR